ncbi:hypothetical protein SVAN01_09309 [Stagonosporopsis vannaccii]|nr:hypothetical protein SVAN01_09309 [Stagonosporopsis vannaccii]
MNFEYDGLSESASKRLLKVLPTKENDLIQVQLWQESKAVPYRCLSYTWGAPTPTLPIKVNGCTMHVGKNLHEFLVIAAQRFANETLWIDAICINQSDSTEKGTQVERMGDTFKEAIEVFVWLGNDEGIARLFDASVCPQTWRHKLRYYIPCERLPRRLRAPAASLKDHDYWKRAWVIQELALARSLRLLCGSSETTFNELKNYSEQGNFSHAIPSSSPCRAFWYVAVSCDLLIRNLPFIIRNPSTWYSASDLDPLFKFIQDDPGLVSKTPPFSFWSIVERRAFCKDPRDRIYSILAITGDASGFEVRYNESTVETFWRAAEHFSAWHSHHRLSMLFESLSLDHESFKAALSASRGTEMCCSIPMRSVRLVRRLGVGFGQKFCELETRCYPDMAIQGSGPDDLLLCPYVNKETSGIHTHVTHFLLSPMTDGSDGFAVCAYAPYVHYHLSLSQHSELWSSEEGVTARVETWKEVLRVAALGGGAGQDWKSKPHFVLRTGQRYVVPFASWQDQE